MRADRVSVAIFAPVACAMLTCATLTCALAVCALVGSGGDAAAFPFGGHGKSAPTAPAPTRPIDAVRFFNGAWYQVARTPEKQTRDCTAEEIQYLPNVMGGVDEVDSCRTLGPKSREKVFTGPVTDLDPGANTKITIEYAALGLFPMKRTVWMLDHDADYGWVIVSDPKFDDVAILTRQAKPDPALVRRLVARTSQLGYDARKLEFPAPPPAPTPGAR